MVRAVTRTAMVFLVYRYISRSRIEIFFEIFLGLCETPTTTATAQDPPAHSLMRSRAISAALLAAAAAAQCVAPGTCTPPATKYSRVIAGPTPGRQWNIAGGFCGAFSLQHAALAQGAWISQDLVRKANRDQPGPHNMHGDTTVGFEVMPSNVAYTAAALRLAFDEWDYTQPQPQAAAYLAWMKRQLAAGSVVAFFPICKGDSHECYTDSCPNGGHCDHVEPIYGLFSNHPLSDGTVYADDYILHASDQDLEPYYRPLLSLPDTMAMEGNCASAGAGFGRNEMYPCIPEDVTYGLAVTGLNVSGVALQPVALLTAGSAGEPDVRTGAPAVPLSGTVIVSALTAGAKYALYRYNSTTSLPASPPLAATAQAVTRFTAQGDTWQWADPVSFPSNGATYYLAAADNA